MRHIFSLVLGVLVVMLSWRLPSESAAQDSTLGQIQKTVESALETEESKMKRGLRELDEQINQKELLRQQQLQLEKLEWEKQQLLRRPRGATSPQMRNNAPIELFIAENCPDCLKAVGYLDALGVSYRTYNISADPAAEQEYLRSFGRGVVPVLRTRGGTLRGYAPEQYRAAATGRTATPDRGSTAADSKDTNLAKGSPAANDFVAGSVAGTETAQPVLDGSAAEAAPVEPPKPTLPPARELESEAGSNVENQFDVSGALDEKPAPSDSAVDATNK